MLFVHVGPFIGLCACCVLTVHMLRVSYRLMVSSTGRRRCSSHTYEQHAGEGRRRQLLSTCVCLTRSTYESFLCRSTQSSATSASSSNWSAYIRAAEYRATLSILAVVILYTLLHTLSLYEMYRRWSITFYQSDLVECLSTSDFVLAEMAVLLNVIGAGVNAFLFVAMTRRVKRYLTSARRTSRQSTERFVAKHQNGDYTHNDTGEMCLHTLCRPKCNLQVYRLSVAVPTMRLR